MREAQALFRKIIRIFACVFSCIGVIAPAVNGSGRDNRISRLFVVSFTTENFRFDPAGPRPQGERHFIQWKNRKGELVHEIELLNSVQYIPPNEFDKGVRLGIKSGDQRGFDCGKKYVRFTDYMEAMISKDEKVCLVSRVEVAVLEGFINYYGRDTYHRKERVECYDSRGRMRWFHEGEDLSGMYMSDDGKRTLWPIWRRAPLRVTAIRIVDERGKIIWDATDPLYELHSSYMNRFSPNLRYCVVGANNKNDHKGIYRAKLDLKSKTCKVVKVGEVGNFIDHIRCLDDGTMVGAYPSDSFPDNPDVMRAGQIVEKP